MRTRPIIIVVIIAVIIIIAAIVLKRPEVTNATTPVEHNADPH